MDPAAALGRPAARPRASRRLHGGRGLSATVLLSGGTGGAKLARGLLDSCDELTVVANTADDVEVYGVHVSPDPDLVGYWLADQIDDRGWGLRGDTDEVMSALKDAGRDAWFHLGDRDLAMCLIRTQALRSGRRLTEAHAELMAALAVSARVLPMSDERVSTWVEADGRWIGFQEFMILESSQAPVSAVELRGIEQARPTAEVLASVASAELIVIGPSNPVISIGPILALPGMRDALRAAPARVVAVSPFVDGRAVKGPTERFCAAAGIDASAQGIARAYGDLLDGIVADERVEQLPCLEIDTLMDTPGRRSEVARKILEFGRKLRP